MVLLINILYIFYILIVEMRLFVILVFVILF